jgi:cobalamin biosynthesis Mg chelatase CobN
LIRLLGAVAVAFGLALTPTATLMVPPPAGFTALAPPTGVDGPITSAALKQLNITGVSDKDLRDSMDDTWARTYVRQPDRDLLLILGYHLRTEHGAVGFMRAVLDAAESDKRLRVVPGAPEGIVVFDVTDPSRPAGAQESLLRQGRFVYQFVLVPGAAAGTGVKGVALDLARAEQAKLPPGSRSFQDADRSRVGLVLGVVAVLALVGVAVWRWRRPRSP